MQKSNKTVYKDLCARGLAQQYLANCTVEFINLMSSKTHFFLGHKLGTLVPIYLSYQSVIIQDRT